MAVEENGMNMEKKEYFVIGSGDAGMYIYGPYTKTELLKKLTPNAFGDNYFGIMSFHNMLPDHENGDRDFKRGLVIIKGEIVIPEERTVVKEYALP